MSNGAKFKGLWCVLSTGVPFGANTQKKDFLLAVQGKTTIPRLTRLARRGNAPFCVVRAAVMVRG
jgi:hypothetical protein